MNSEQIEHLLKLVTNNATAERRDAAIRVAARLFRAHLKTGPLLERLDGIAATRTGASRIRTRQWRSGDLYLVVQEFQVFKQDGFHDGDHAEVTARNMEHRQSRSRRQQEPVLSLVKIKLGKRGNHHADREQEPSNHQTQPTH